MICYLPKHVCSVSLTGLSSSQTLASFIFQYVFKSSNWARMSPSRWICMDVTDIALPENCPQNESCTCKNTRDRITLFIFIPRQAHRAFNASDVRLTQRNLSLISLRNHTVGLHSFFFAATCLTIRFSPMSPCHRHLHLQSNDFQLLWVTRSHIFRIPNYFWDTWATWEWSGEKKSVTIW